MARSLLVGRGKGYFSMRLRVRAKFLPVLVGLVAAICAPTVAEAQNGQPMTVFNAVTSTGTSTATRWTSSGAVITITCTAVCTNVVLRTQGSYALAGTYAAVGDPNGIYTGGSAAIYIYTVAVPTPYVNFNLSALGSATIVSAYVTPLPNPPRAVSSGDIATGGTVQVDYPVPIGGTSGTTRYVVSVDSSGALLTRSGGGGGATQVEGVTASGAALTENPIAGGGRADTTSPTAVADGQKVAAYMTVSGGTVGAGLVDTTVPSSGADGSPKEVFLEPTGAQVVAGFDGTNPQKIATNTSGHPIVAGSGTAGSAATGVVTIQGIASMTPILATGTGTAGSAATGVVTVQGIASMTPVIVNQSQVNGVAVSTGIGNTDTGTQRVQNAATATLDSGLTACTAVVSTAGGTTVLAAYAGRRQGAFRNSDTMLTYCALGATPTATSYHFALRGGTVDDDGLGDSFSFSEWSGTLVCIAASGTGHVCGTAY